MPLYNFKPPNDVLYVKALTGIFMSRENPTGITEKESYMLAHIKRLFREHNTEQLNQEIRKKLRIAFSVKEQSLHNMISTLKKKKLLTKDNRLHKILRDDATIKIIQGD
jgi:uncharacterized protein YdcH (DUF465 family)